MQPGQSAVAFSGEIIPTTLNAGLAPIHYKIEVPAYTSAITFQFSVLEGSGRFVLHLRDGQAVQVDASENTVVSSWDIAIAETQVTLTSKAISALHDGTTLFLAVENRDSLDGNAWFRLSYESFPEHTFGGGGCSLGTKAGSMAMTEQAVLFFVLFLIFLRRFYALRRRTL
ncbi:MAG: hypothetical protein IPJ88_02300 [Myxococcales bacterium]|nr:MAG: hypothetical protein IPJ88_02300 [Myxococcales bacterium]